MTYEQAKAKALSIDDEYDTCYDYGTAWVFSVSTDNGKNDRVTVIVKKSGKIISFTDFLFTRNTNASPKKIPF